MVLILRGKKAAEWGKYYASRPHEETLEGKFEFLKEHARFAGYLQALDDIQNERDNHE